VSYELGFYIPYDGILHSHRRENLRSYLLGFRSQGEEGPESFSAAGGSGILLSVDLRVTSQPDSYLRFRSRFKNSCRLALVAATSWKKPGLTYMISLVLNMQILIGRKFIYISYIPEFLLRTIIWTFFFRKWPLSAVLAAQSNRVAVYTMACALVSSTQ
jgi:hypothetical protein